MKQADGPTAILEVVYRTTAHWAHPIRRAIEGNPILAKRDEGLEKQTIEVGEILKTRTGFCDECCRSEKNLLDGLVVVERKGSAAVQVIADRASDVSAAKFLIQFFEVVVEKHDDSRQVRSARFDRERTVRERAYCNRTIGEPESYDVLARSTGESAWSDALRRIRGDLIHERSLFLAFDIGAAGSPIFSMNWRPGHFGPGDRIELRTLVAIWEGLFQAALAMQAKIVQIARQEAHD